MFTAKYVCSLISYSLIDVWSISIQKQMQIAMKSTSKLLLLTCPDGDKMASSESWDMARLGDN